MSFLDNSGDIILDAVLTDLGRKRLAEGNGRFNIQQFALGDDEIDYGLYDKNNASGSAYYDLNILQTPVLEAFTNNMSSMKSRLLSYSDNDLLYLPVILTNTTAGGQPFYTGLNSYVVLVDQTTVTTVAGEGTNALAAGILNGFRPSEGANYVETDQGLDTTELSPDQTLAQYNDLLVETQYFVQIDNRLGELRAAFGEGSFSPSSIDDDNIATYIFSRDDATRVVSNVASNAASIVRGPRGSRVQLKIASSLDLKTSSFLFDQLGSTGTTDIGDLASGNYKFIDTIVRISGVSTGYTLDVPVRFVKQN
jgi:hypothetical protein